MLKKASFLIEMSVYIIPLLLLLIFVYSFLSAGTSEAGETTDNFIGVCSKSTILIETEHYAKQGDLQEVLPRIERLKECTQGKIDEEIQLSVANFIVIAVANYEKNPNTKISEYQKKKISTLLREFVTEKEAKVKVCESANLKGIKYCAQQP